MWHLWEMQQQNNILRSKWKRRSFHCKLKIQKICRTIMHQFILSSLFLPVWWEIHRVSQTEALLLLQVLAFFNDKVSFAFSSSLWFSLSNQQRRKSADKVCRVPGVDSQPHTRDFFFLHVFTSQNRQDDGAEGAAAEDKKLIKGGRRRRRCVIFQSVETPS